MLAKIWRWFSKHILRIEPPDPDELLSPFQNDNWAKSEIPPKQVTATPDEVVPTAVYKARLKRERKKKRNIWMRERGAYGKHNHTNV